MEDSPDGGDPLFASGPLSEAVVGAFALGSAIALEFPDRIIDILEQTHPGESGAIIDECREPLEQQTAALRGSSEPLEPEDFVDSLLQAIDQGDNVDSDTAQNALSMSFEYGCILAHVQRSAAIMVRNAYNRGQEEAVGEFEGEGDDVPAGPDPFQSLQELATEIMEAYVADIGFGSG
ncbi:MAG: hypothetical protein V3S98_04945 [Dehalococcoidia bacterium]